MVEKHFVFCLVTDCLGGRPCKTLVLLIVFSSIQQKNFVVNQLFFVTWSKKITPKAGKKIIERG